MRYFMQYFSFKFAGMVFAFLLLTLSGGCTSPSRDAILTHADMPEIDRNNGRLNVFLTLKDVNGPAIRMTVADIEFLADGVWLPLVNGPVTIDSAELGSGQLLLGAEYLPPGRYPNLRMRVINAEVRGSKGEYVPIDQEPLQVEIILSEIIELEAGDSRCLLLSWDLQESLPQDNVLSPSLVATVPLKQLPIDLVFVSCPEIDTIFVVSADKNWVVDSFGLKGSPTYMAVDPNLSSPRLYVLASGERKIKVVEPQSYRVIDFFPTPLNDQPTFMMISQDGRSGYLMDERSGYLSRIDLSNGQSIARTHLGYRPNYALYLEQQNLLAVSLALSQKVVLLDPENLKVRGTFPTGSSPQGLAVLSEQLYIAESGDDTVSIVALGGGRGQNRLGVGFGPRRLLITENQIYVSNYLEGSLSVLLPGQLGVVQNIADVGKPVEMVYDQFYQRLYVADEKTGGLTVIDVNSNTIIGRIPLGAKPLDLIVVQ
jgi:YVTN family beta-propeller protein